VNDNKITEFLNENNTDTPGNIPDAVTNANNKELKAKSYAKTIDLPVS